MIPVKRITLKEFQNKDILIPLLHADQPFIIQGFPPHHGAYNKALEIFENSNLNLFNLLGHCSETGEVRSYHELLELISKLKTMDSQPGSDAHLLWKKYAGLFSKYLIDSQVLDTHRDFNVQLEVHPMGEVLEKLVLPATLPYSHILQGFARRSYLNTVLNISRGKGSLNNKAKGIHAHNYDTFAIIGQAENQTSAYFFPPEYYLQFKARVLSSDQGILLLIPHENVIKDNVLDDAFTYDNVEVGDIVYTPPLWFHCFHHSGEYMSIANGEFFPDLLQKRLPKIGPKVFGDDWKNIASATQRLQNYSIRA